MAAKSWRRGGNEARSAVIIHLMASIWPARAAYIYRHVIAAQGYVARAT